MFKVISKNGNCLEKTDEIRKETKDFYENLYSEKECNDIDLDSYVKNLPKLSETEAASLEGTITLEEASDVLKNMKNGKSPGTDGMTVDFLIFF